MLVFDQLKKDDAQLRFLAVIVAGGVALLLAGLWWVQVVSSHYYQEKLETQSIRTVRLPAVRGNILDRDGRPLAENRPSYNVDLYLGDLSRKFQESYSNSIARVQAALAAQKAAEKKKLKSQLGWWQKWQLDKKLARLFPLTAKMREAIARQTHYEVSSNIVADLGARLQQSIPFDQKYFQRGYEKALALPMPILANLTPPSVARFEEQSMRTPGMDLDIQSLRYYPNGSLAYHVLGYVNRNSESGEGETSDYNYRLNDYAGLPGIGIEGLFDDNLRGAAGAKSVLVDNLGYRRGESVLSPAEPGDNVVLTLDLDIQKAAEKALQEAQANVHGAVVVMNATNGDILAMASAPTFNPNYYVQHPEPATWAQEWARLQDNDLKVQSNRAMHENYRPGSLFKIVVGLAALEQGVLNPTEIFVSDHVHANGKAYWPVGNREVGDTAPPGKYDLDRAVALSCNSYFIFNGLKPGVLGKIISLGKSLHLGERTGLMPRQETPGRLPDPTHWTDGEIANLCIGQGEIDVTPVQMAVMGAAVADHGKVFYPRLVSRVETFDGSLVVERFPEGRVRDNLGVSERSLNLMRHAMLQDVESPEGTGKGAFMEGFRIAGKTGTAEVSRNGQIERSAKETWFLSFAPFENPRYVVVAMVEGGASGGLTCVPLVKKVYQAILAREQERSKKPVQRGETLAEMR